MKGDPAFPWFFWNIPPWGPSYHAIRKPKQPDREAHGDVLANRPSWVFIWKPASATRYAREWAFNNGFLHPPILTPSLDSWTPGCNHRFCCSQGVEKGTGNRPEPQSEDSPAYFLLLPHPGLCHWGNAQQKLICVPLLFLSPAFCLSSFNTVISSFLKDSVQRASPEPFTWNVTHMYQLKWHQPAVTDNAQGWTTFDTFQSQWDYYSGLCVY